MERLKQSLKKILAWVLKIITTKEWIFTYPYVLLVLVIFIAHSLWAFLALALWVITVIYNTDEE
jgi:hypothetical protein